MNTFIPTLLVLAFLVCPIAALLFIVRLVVASFSAKVSVEMRRHPVMRTIWGCFAFVGVLIIFGVLHTAMWPPRSVERREQRAKIIERIQSAGGWPALQKDCDTLASSIKTAHLSGIVVMTPTHCLIRLQRSIRGMCAFIRRRFYAISKMSHRFPSSTSRYSVFIRLAGTQFHILDLRWFVPPM